MADNNTVNTTPNTRLGYGFAPQIGQAKSLAFKSVPKSVPPIDDAGNFSKAEFKLSDTFEETRDFLQLDISAGYGWMTGSVEARASILNSSRFSSHTITVVGHALEVTPAERLSKDPVFSAEAKALLKKKKLSNSTTVLDLILLIRLAKAVSC